MYVKGSIEIGNKIRVIWEKIKDVKIRNLNFM